MFRMATFEVGSERHLFRSLIRKWIVLMIEIRAIQFTEYPPLIFNFRSPFNDIDFTERHRSVENP